MKIIQKDIKVYNKICTCGQYFTKLPGCRNHSPSSGETTPSAHYKKLCCSELLPARMC